MPNNSMVVMGIDPGLGCTAWAVLEIMRSGTTRYAKSLFLGETRRQANYPLAPRLWDIYDSIDRALAGWKPVVVGVEAGYIGPNRRSAGVLAMARGAAIAAVGCFSTDAYTEVTPQAVKLEVGSGRATKEQVRRGMQLLLMRDEMSYDQADAAAIALAAENFRWRSGKDLRTIRGGV